jgi:hypothetical protein
MINTTQEMSKGKLASKDLTALPNKATLNTILAMGRAKDPGPRATAYLSMWSQMAGQTTEPLHLL